MRVLLLVNSTASSVTARTRVVIRKMLADQHEVEVAETSRRGHATRLARAAANDGFDVVAVLAGDGTLNEAADGLAGTDTALAPLPGGSTNVYARTLGVPLDPVAATSTLLASLHRRAFDAHRARPGRTAGRFLFNTGLGFDAAVIRRVERYGELKRYASHPLHVLAAFETWFRHYDHSKPRFDIDARERRTDRRRLLRDRLEDRAVHLPRPPAARRRARSRARHRARAHRVPVLRRSITLLGGAASAMGSGKYLQRTPGIVQRHDLRELRVEGRGRSRIRPTATTSATPSTSTSTTRPTRSRSSCPNAQRPSSATSGTFVMIASTPAAASTLHLVGVVDGPHVDVQVVRATCATAAPGAASTDVAIGVQPRVPVRCGHRRRGRDRLPVHEPRRSASSGASARTASTARGRTTRRRRRASTRRATQVDGRAHDRVLGVGVGLPRQSTSPRRSRASRAARRALPPASARRAARRGLRERLLHEQPEPVRPPVVVHDQDAVGGAAHVELDAVGTELARRARTRRPCSPGAAVGAPVGEDERTRSACSPATASRRRNVFHFWR